MHPLTFCCILFLFNACAAQTPSPELATEVVDKQTDTIKQKYQLLFQSKPEYKSNGFDFPVGKPDAKGYYNAQGFGGKSYHLGDDWNALTGGNSDLGHPIYTIGHGYVTLVKDFRGGWGQVVRVVHKVDEQTYVESLYAHCNEVFVKEGDWVKKGDKIATIGNNNGMYYAHLHLEIRLQPDMPLGGGYSRDTTGYTDPTAWIKAHRK